MLLWSNRNFQNIHARMQKFQKLMQDIYPLYEPTLEALLEFGRVATKPVFGVSDKARLKSVSSLTETS